MKKTLQECKDEVAQNIGSKNWEDLTDKIYGLSNWRQTIQKHADVAVEMYASQEDQPEIKSWAHIITNVIVIGLFYVLSIMVAVFLDLLARYIIGPFADLKLDIGMICGALYMLSLTRYAEKLTNWILKVIKKK